MHEGVIETQVRIIDECIEKGQSPEKINKAISRALSIIIIHKKVIIGDPSVETFKLDQIKNVTEKLNNADEEMLSQLKTSFKENESDTKLEIAMDLLDPKTPLDRISENYKMWCEKDRELAKPHSKVIEGQLKTVRTKSRIEHAEKVIAIHSKILRAAYQTKTKATNPDTNLTEKLDVIAKGLAGCSYENREKLADYEKIIDEYQSAALEMVDKIHEHINREIQKESNGSHETPKN